MFNLPFVVEQICNLFVERARHSGKVEGYARYRHQFMEIEPAVSNGAMTRSVVFIRQRDGSSEQGGCEEGEVATGPPHLLNLAMICVIRPMARNRAFLREIPTGLPMREDIGYVDPVRRGYADFARWDGPKPACRALLCRMRGASCRLCSLTHRCGATWPLFATGDGVHGMSSWKMPPFPQKAAFGNFYQCVVCKQFFTKVVQPPGAAGVPFCRSGVDRPI